jgi:hypothetical protein
MKKHICCLSPQDGVAISSNDLDKVLIELCIGCLLRRKYTVVIFPNRDMRFDEFKKCERTFGSIFTPLKLKPTTFIFANEHMLEFASLDDLHRGSFRGTSLNAIIYYKV